jgi:hypothetical protein
MDLFLKKKLKRLPALRTSITLWMCTTILPLPRRPSIGNCVIPERSQGVDPQRAPRPVQVQLQSVSVAEFNSSMSSAGTAISELTAATHKCTAADEAECGDDDQWGCVPGGIVKFPSLPTKRRGRNQRIDPLTLVFPPFGPSSWLSTLNVT